MKCSSRRKTWLAGAACMLACAGRDNSVTGPFAALTSASSSLLRIAASAGFRPRATNSPRLVMKSSASARSSGVR